MCSRPIWTGTNWQPRWRCQISVADPDRPRHHARRSLLGACGRCGRHRAAIKKTLYIGFFAFLIGNFNKLAKIIFDSFSGLGLKAAGSGLSAADFLHPGRIAQVGLDAGTPILTATGQLMGYVSFFEILFRSPSS